MCWVKCCAHACLRATQVGLWRSMAAGSRGGTAGAAVLPLALLPPWHDSPCSAPPAMPPAPLPLPPRYHLLCCLLPCRRCCRCGLYYVPLLFVFSSVGQDLLAFCLAHPEVRLAASGVSMTSAHALSVVVLRGAGGGAGRGGRLRCGARA